MRACPKLLPKTFAREPHSDYSASHVTSNKERISEYDAVLVLTRLVGRRWRLLGGLGYDPLDARMSVGRFAQIAEYTLETDQDGNQIRSGMTWHQIHARRWSV